MIGKTSRRGFIKTGLTLGAAAVIGGNRVQGLMALENEGAADIGVVKGTDYFANTEKAVRLVGGMTKFVPKGGRVGLLVNAPQWWKLPGSHVNTDIVLAAVKMVLDAGVKEIVYLWDPSSDMWKRSPLSAKFDAEVRGIRPHSGDYVETSVKDGLALKKGRIIKDLFECDALIDISVAKDHTGTRFSCCLKNYMGACQGDTNQYFHLGSGKGKGEYDDIDFLSQCIADVNTLRKPDLLIADATVVLATNGPAGPGDLVRPQKIVAGRDIVSVDTYCAGLLGRKPADILMLKKAADHGLGRTDLDTISIKEISV